MVELYNNATVYAYKMTGKWYAMGRFRADVDLFLRCHSSEERRARLLHLCGGKCPGLRGPGNDMVLVVIPDDHAPSGFPLMIWPVGVSAVQIGEFMLEKHNNVGTRETRLDRSGPRRHSRTVPRMGEVVRHR